MSNPSYLDWLWPVIRPLRTVFREVAAVSLFLNLMALAVPLFSLQVYDRVVGHAGLTTLQGLAVGMALLIAFDFVLRQARCRMLQSVALRIDVHVGRRLFDKLLALPLAVLESKPAGAWHGLMRDLDTVRSTLSGVTAVLMADLPFLVVNLVLAFVIATPIAWVLTVALIAFCALAWVSGAQADNAAKRGNEATAARDRLVAEVVQVRATVKALAFGDVIRPLWETRQAEALDEAMSRGRRTDTQMNLGAALTTATLVAMTATGALAIIDHQMTIGALIASNMLTGRLLGPLNLLVGSWRTVLGFRQSAGRLGMLFAETEEPQRRVIALERPRGRLVAEELSFAYDNERPVVDTVTVAVEPGGLTAILGRNGSGKTTLVKLLQGLYRPLHGRVLLDGGDIGQFTRRELADWIGYVPQETVLLSGSIRDNLAHGAPGASDAQIVAAAVKAGAHDFILDLPAGYGTPVGEAGARLSGGQRQRLAIARALIGDPPVLILDEPSANLDRRAEEELRETLLELAQDRSVLLVTHSPILLSACLSVVVLEAGRVVASGAANEVLPSLFQSAQPQPRPLPAPPHPLRRPRQVGAPA